MKKLLIQTEYFCILHLIACPFLIMFYHRGTLMLWAMLIFLDGAELILKIDEKKVWNALQEEHLKLETQRIKIYLGAIVLFYLCMPFMADWKLFFIILINDIIASALCIVFQKYIWEQEEDDEAPWES